MEVKISKKQFSLMEDGVKIGKLDYVNMKEHIDVIFLGVNIQYRGTDAKNYLIDALLELCEKEQKKVFATCKYMRKWLSRNKPELLINDFQ